MWSADGCGWRDAHTAQPPALLPVSRIHLAAYTDCIHSCLPGFPLTDPVSLPRLRTYRPLPSPWAVLAASVQPPVSPSPWASASQGSERRRSQEPQAQAQAVPSWAAVAAAQLLPCPAQPHSLDASRPVWPAHDKPHSTCHLPCHPSLSPPHAGPPMRCSCCLEEAAAIYSCPHPHLSPFDWLIPSDA